MFIVPDVPNLLRSPTVSCFFQKLHCTARLLEPMIHKSNRSSVTLILKKNICWVCLSLYIGKYKSLAICLSFRHCYCSLVSLKGCCLRSIKQLKWIISLSKFISLSNYVQRYKESVNTSIMSIMHNAYASVVYNLYTTHTKTLQFCGLCMHPVEPIKSLPSFFLCLMPDFKKYYCEVFYHSEPILLSLYNSLAKFKVTKRINIFQSRMTWEPQLAVVHRTRCTLASFPFLQETPNPTNPSYCFHDCNRKDPIQIQVKGGLINPPN